MGCFGKNRAVDSRPSVNSQISRSMQIVELYLKYWLGRKMVYILCSIKK